MDSLALKSIGLNGNPLPWLIEVDANNPGVRYRVLRNLLGRSKDDPELREARTAVMEQGPVPLILATQDSEGFWVKPGGGYSPSYRATIWQIIFLANLAADPNDPRVQQGCEYILNHSIASNGAFSMGERPVPSTTIHCLNGDLIDALATFGYIDDPRWQAAVDWQASAIIGEGEIRFYRSGTTGPNFGCVANKRMPCAWGATKAMKGFASIPPGLRTAAASEALDLGIDFLLSHDPAIADYPYIERVNSNWFKFGFPLSYSSDVLETVSILVELGCGSDPRLQNALQFILSKQDSQGRWKMEKTLNGKMWADVEQKGEPSKWITYRALRIFLMVSGNIK